MKVLFLDDDQGRHDAFKDNGHDVVRVYTAKDAIFNLHLGERYDLACLDHDLGGRQFVPSDDPEGTGYTVAKAICAMPAPPKRVIVHSYNPVGVKNMIEALKAAGVPCIAAPFGTFTLDPVEQVA